MGEHVRDLVKKSKSKQATGIEGRLFQIKVLRKDVLPELGLLGLL